MIASINQLQTYLADLAEHIERFGVTILPPDKHDEIELLQTDSGDIVIELACRPPLAPRSKDVAMQVIEIWRSVGKGNYERDDYKFELRDQELQFRRAYHRHDTDYFIHTYNVVTHEHCEVTIGNVRCGHYAGVPVRDAFDGFDRIYNTWLDGHKPECALLRCLG